MTDLQGLIRESLVPVAALARACGVSRQHLYDVMHGRASPSKGLVASMAETLGYARKVVLAAVKESRRRGPKATTRRESA